MTVLTVLNPETIVGMTEEEALNALVYSGYNVRVRGRDDQRFMGTFEVRSDRMNLTIVDGIVIKASIG